MEIYGEEGDIWRSRRYMENLEIYGELGDIWRSRRYMEK